MSDQPNYHSMQGADTVNGNPAPLLNGAPAAQAHDIPMADAPFQAVPTTQQFPPQQQQPPQYQQPFPQTQPQQQQQQQQPPISPQPTTTAPAAASPAAQQPISQLPSTSTAPAPGPATPGFAMPSEAAPNGAPVRQYINSKITGVLLEGMKIVAREQPKDPLRVLGEFLLQRSRELEEGFMKAGSTVRQRSTETHFLRWRDIMVRK